MATVSIEGRELLDPEFYPCFSEVKAGDIILQCEDTKTCFYAPGKLLASLSTFFGEPGTLPHDLEFDGVPVITLPRTTNAGIDLFLRALHALRSPPGRQWIQTDDLSALNAALICNMYDVPGVLFVLLRAYATRDSHHNRLLHWAVAALGGCEALVFARLEEITGNPLLRIPNHVRKALKENAPKHWQRFIEADLASIKALAKLKRSLRKLDVQKIRRDLQPFKCEICLDGFRSLEDDIRRLLEAESRRDVDAVMEEFWDQCDCGKMSPRCVHMKDDVEAYSGSVDDW